MLPSVCPVIYSISTQAALSHHLSLPTALSQRFVMVHYLQYLFPVLLHLNAIYAMYIEHLWRNWSFDVEATLNFIYCYWVCSLPAILVRINCSAKQKRGLDKAEQCSCEPVDLYLRWVFILHPMELQWVSTFFLYTDLVECLLHISCQSYRLETISKKYVPHQIMMRWSCLQAVIQRRTFLICSCWCIINNSHFHAFCRLSDYRLVGYIKLFTLWLSRHFYDLLLKVLLDYFIILIHKMRILLQLSHKTT